MQGRIAKPLTIGEVVPLTREDLAKLYEPRAVANRVEKIRHSHHKVAMALAFGCSRKQVAEITGYSGVRITTLSQSPAFQALVEQYRGKIDEQNITTMNDAMSEMLELRRMSNRHLRDRIEELDEVGELLPFKQALQLHDSMADRTGYGKHSTQTNLNVNFATTLEERIRKIKGESKTIDAKVIPLITRRL